jgi:Asp-tRNA(Asn)/Glu-tRNA(Gln) amidotransferase C subunit
MSGTGSNTTNGGGLASRFSMALSKIIDFNSAINESDKKGMNSPDNVGETEDDMNEILNLIEELNKH